MEAAPSSTLRKEYTTDGWADQVAEAAALLLAREKYSYVVSRWVGQTHKLSPDLFCILLQGCCYSFQHKGGMRYQAAAVAEGVSVPRLESLWSHRPRKQGDCALVA